MRRKIHITPSLPIPVLRPKDIRRLEKVARDLHKGAVVFLALMDKVRDFSGLAGGLLDLATEANAGVDRIRRLIDFSKTVVPEAKKGLIVEVYPNPNFPPVYDRDDPKTVLPPIQSPVVHQAMSFKIDLAHIPKSERHLVKTHLGHVILTMRNRDFTYAQIAKWFGVSQTRVRDLDLEMNGTGGK